MLDLDQPQVVDCIVQSFPFGSGYHSACGLTDTFGKNALGFGRAFGKFNMGRRQALIKTNFPLEFLAGITRFSGVWHCGDPVSSVPLLL